MAWVDWIVEVEVEGLEANQYVVCSLSSPAQCFFLTFPIFCIKLYPLLHFHTSVPPTSTSSSLLWTQSIINFCPIELGRCPWGRPPAKTVFCRGLNQLNKGRGGGWLTAKFPLTTQFGYQRIGPRAVLWTLLKFIYFFKWVFIHIALISTSPVVVVRQVNRTVHNDAL